MVVDNLPEEASYVELGEQELRGLNRPERIRAVVDTARPVREAISGLCPYKGLLAFHRTRRAIEATPDPSRRHASRTLSCTSRGVSLRRMADGAESRKRRGPKFVVKVVLLGIAAVIALAIAGDDELRGSLASRLKGS
jgi:hypothetical protein